MESRIIENLNKFYLPYEGQMFEFHNTYGYDGKYLFHHLIFYIFKEEETLSYSLCHNIYETEVTLGKEYTVDKDYFENKQKYFYKSFDHGTSYNSNNEIDIDYIIKTFNEQNIKHIKRWNLI